MKKMNKRKGFTLTELAIVIAVIAILIAVLVPTFVSLINKAKESNDSQLAKNMNTLLTDEEISGNTPTRMEDVNEILVNGGYTIAKLTPSADGNIFVWNEETNRISYISTENWSVIYAGDSTLSTGDILDRTNNYWVTVESASEISSWSGLSYYFGANITGNVTFTADSSVDTGTYKLNGTLTYGKTSTTSAIEQQTAKTSVNSVKTEKAATASTTGTAKIMGTIATLDVNNSGIYVNNYASVTSTRVTSTKAYTESGYSKTLTVSNTDVSVTIASSGVVETLQVKDSSNVTNISNNGYVKSAVLTDNTSTTVSSLVTNTSTYKYTISSYSELASFRDKVNNGATFSGITVTLTANIDLSGRVWTPIGFDDRDKTYKVENKGETNEVRTITTSGSYNCFSGIFDGNGKTISGLTNTGFAPTTLRPDTYGITSKSNYVYGLFGILYNATIKDLSLTNVNIVEETDTGVSDSVGAIAGYACGTVKITNCTVSGSITGVDAVGGIVGRILALEYDTDPTVTISGCTNNATITATDAKAGGIVGYYRSYNTKISSSGSTSKATLSITGCTNKGSVTSGKWAAGIVITDPGDTTQKNSTITIDSSTTNSGTIKANKTEDVQMKSWS